MESDNISMHAKLAVAALAFRNPSFRLDFDDGIIKALKPSVNPKIEVSFRESAS